MTEVGAIGGPLPASPPGGRCPSCRGADAPADCSRRAARSTPPSSCRRGRRDRLSARLDHTRALRERAVLSRIPRSRRRGTTTARATRRPNSSRPGSRSTRTGSRRRSPSGTASPARGARDRVRARGFPARRCARRPAAEAWVSTRASARSGSKAPQPTGSRSGVHSSPRRTSIERSRSSSAVTRSSMSMTCTSSSCGCGRRSTPLPQRPCSSRFRTLGASCARRRSGTCSTSTSRYFTPGSLARAFRAAGLRPTKLETRVRRPVSVADRGSRRRSHEPDCSRPRGRPAVTVARRIGSFGARSRCAILGRQAPRAPCAAASGRDLGRRLEGRRLPLDARALRRGHLRGRRQPREARHVHARHRSRDRRPGTAPRRCVRASSWS